MSFPKKFLRWSAAFSYVALIYFTLEWIRIPAQFLRSHNMLRLFLAFLYSCCFIWAFLQWRRFHKQTWWRITVVAIIFAAGYVISRSALRTPEETIHFFEYGLVGILFARAFELHVDSKLKTFFLSFLLATFCGWIDEKLQDYSPYRSYEIKDVVLNAVSAIFGLSAFYLVRPPNSLQFSSEKPQPE
jgi:hypothetical protein